MLQKKNYMNQNIIKNKKKAIKKIMNKNTYLMI
jgi:hypothetical protein